MNSFVLQLLAFASFAVAMPAIDNGMDSHVFGPERVVTDFAVLSSSNTDNLPSDFTVCSSVTSGGAFTGPIAPFQLLDWDALHDQRKEHHESTGYHAE